jgi:hypothetical protein
MVVHTNIKIVVFSTKVELLIIPEHLSSPPVCSGDRVSPSLNFCVVFCKIIIPFFKAIVLSVFSFHLWSLVTLSLSSTFSYLKITISFELAPLSTIFQLYRGDEFYW